MKIVLKIILLIFFIIILICTFEIWISYNVITVSNFTVISDKVMSPFRIVLISDLHDHQFGSENDELIKKIGEQYPDIIILDGDMINMNSENDNVVVKLVDSLIEIAPVYYSYGNHEYSYLQTKGDSLQNNLEMAGVVILNHQNVDIEVNGNFIRLGGLYEYGFETDMQSDEYNEQAISYLNNYVDTGRYLIMCAHRPDSFYPWEYADIWGLDLVLSGHLHGGQVIIPGVGGLYSQLEGLFPKYDYGQYKLGDCDMIITRGLGSNPKLFPRFNNPPEIAVVDIMPDE